MNNENPSNPTPPGGAPAPAPAAPAAPGPDVAALQVQIAARDAADHHGLTGEARRLYVEQVTATYRGGDFTAHADSYATRYKTAFPTPPSGTPAYQPGQAPPRAPIVSTGAPGTTQPILDADPNKIDPQVFRSLPWEEQRKRLDSWLSSGGRRNPLRPVGGDSHRRGGGR